MAFFTKKPVTIEAREWDGNARSGILEWIGLPGAVSGAGQLLIETLEGEMTASPGDMIIRGVKGEFYACKPDIFEMTYDEETDEFQINASQRALENFLSNKGAG